MVPGGGTGFALLAGTIALDEAVSVMLGGEIGAMLWILFHFVVNPTLCGLFIIFTVAKAALVRKPKVTMLYLAFVVAASAYIYVAVSGNIWWLEFFGIDFNR